MQDPEKLLILLQLVSPGLPVGAYNYSEGLEALISKNIIKTQEDLFSWLEAELCYGSIRVETAIIVRVYHSLLIKNLDDVNYWNSWLSAARESKELREQNWQMGQSLFKLLLKLEPQTQSLISKLNSPHNYAVIFGFAIYFWEIELGFALISYLHSWAYNLVNAGVKLIPLGQTAGQQILFELKKIIPEVSQEILGLKDNELSSCNWGLSLATMNHETLYSRLFRS